MIIELFKIESLVMTIFFFHLKKFLPLFFEARNAVLVHVPSICRLMARPNHYLQVTHLDANLFVKCIFEEIQCQ